MFQNPFRCLRTAELRFSTETPVTTGQFSPGDATSAASSGLAPAGAATRRAGVWAAGAASGKGRTCHTFVFPRPPPPSTSSSSPHSSSSPRARRYVRSSIPAAVHSSSFDSPDTTPSASASAAIAANSSRAGPRRRVRDRTASNNSALTCASHHGPSDTNGSDTGIEIGWGSPTSSGRTLAQQMGDSAAANPPAGAQTTWGESFKHFFGIH